MAKIGLAQKKALNFILAIWLGGYTKNIYLWWNNYSMSIYQNNLKLKKKKRKENLINFPFENQKIESETIFFQNL